MQTLSFQAPDEIKQKLDFFADELDRSKGYIIRHALEEYLNDLDDYIKAKEYKATYNPAENTSLDEIKREFDL